MLEGCAQVLAAFLGPRALDLGGSLGGLKTGNLVVLREI